MRLNKISRREETGIVNEPTGPCPLRYCRYIVNLAKVDQEEASLEIMNYCDRDGQSCPHLKKGELI